MVKKFKKFLNNNVKNIIAIILIILLIATVTVFTLRSKEGKNPNDNKVLQVGLVNEDNGGIFNDVKYNFGQDFVNLLTQDRSVSWYSVPRGVAENGIQHKKYDLIVILPYNFSKKILNFQAADFKKVKVLYKIRENKNPNLRTKITQINNSILNRLNYRVSEMYIASILFNLHQAQNHLQSINNNEQDLSNKLKGNINNPLADFLKQYSTAMGTPSPSSNVKQPDDSSNFPPYFNLNNLFPNDELSDSTDKINDSINQAQNEANKQLTDIVSQGNSLIKKNNADFLETLSNQFSTYQEVMNNEGIYVSRLQGTEIQKQISDLLNEPAWHDTNSAAIMESFSNQKFQLSTARAKINNYLDGLGSVTNIYGNYENINNHGLADVKKTLGELIINSISQLPVNSDDVLSQVSLTSTGANNQIAKLQQQLAEIEQIYPNVSFNGAPVNIATSRSAGNDTITLNLPANSETVIDMDNNKVDLDNLYSQIINQGFSNVAVANNQVIIVNNGANNNITVQPRLISNNTIADYSIISDGEYVDQGQIDLAPTLEAPDDLSILDFTSKLEQAYTLVSAFYNTPLAGQLNQPESIFRTSSYRKEKKIQDSSAKRLLLSLLININSAYDSIDELEEQYQELLNKNQQANKDVQKLAYELQSLYQTELDTYRDHLRLMNAKVDLDTTLLPVPNPIDLSSISDIAMSNNHLNSQHQQRLQQALKEMLSSSQKLTKNVDSQVTATSNISNNSQEFVKNGSKILGQSKLLLKNWKAIVKNNDKYNRNIGESMANTRNDDNTAHKIYGNLANPLQFQNTGTIRNVSSIFPYFLTLVNIIIGGFTAMLIVNNDNLKFKLKLWKIDEGDSEIEELESNKNSLYQQYSLILIIIVSLVLAIFSWRTVSGYAERTIWIILETLIQASLIELSVIFFQTLQSFGRFLFTFFFIEYIFYTPALGLYLTKSTMVEMFLKYASPFQQIEDIYTKIFTNNIDYVLVIIIFALILFVAVLFNLIVRGRINAKEDVF